jgi:CubicO group peptidase (beta-lactamase class C family)
LKPMGRTSILLACGCIVLIPCRGTAQITPAPNAADMDAKLIAIEKTIEAKRNEMHVGGAALAIVKDDRIIFCKGFGMRDIAARLPVTPHTLFAIGSCTKAFTGMAALIAQEQGKLSITDPPRKYLPYFKLQDPDTDARVTIADLLSHRTGLMAYTDLPWFTGVLRPEQVIQAMADAKPTAKPGEKFQYNNVMFLAAGECIAAGYGTGYADVIRRQIFTPLGMRESNLSIREMQRAADHATGYDAPESDKPLRLLPMRDLTNIAPAGAINSNVIDMAQWIRLMLGGGQIDGKRLISAGSYRELVSPHISAGPNRAYGYGWVLDTWHGHRQIWHNGGIDGFNAHLAMLPDEHLGFILLTNISESGLPNAAVDAVFSELTAPANAASPVTAGPVDPPSDPDPGREAGDYVLGNAQTGRTLPVTVAYRDNRLFLHPQGQPEFALTLVGARRYALAPPAPSGVFITFRPTKTDPGRTELVLEQEGATIIGAPVSQTAFAAPISVEELMRRRLEAVGGETTLRNYHTLELVMSMQMENEGVTGECRRYWRLPGQYAEVDRYHAAGRDIGMTHEFYDGVAARTETTFSPPDVSTGKSLTDARIHAMFAPELDWKLAFKTVTIERMGKVDDEDVYVVRQTPTGGGDVVDYVSARSFLLLKREMPGGVSETLRSYQKVGDVLLPFEIDRSDSNGRTVLKVKSARFDARLSPDLFLPGYRRCRK